MNIPDPAGRHRERIPDGQLCSAGRAKYAGLDLARADWRATAMTPGRQTSSFAATAAHRGAFELYLTRQGYDPTRPDRCAGRISRRNRSHASSTRPWSQAPTSSPSTCRRATPAVT